MKSKGKNVVAKYLNERVIDQALVNEPPTEGLEIILVVPCFKEELASLLRLCQSLHVQSSDIHFELIIVVNNFIEDKKAYQINQQLLDQKSQFSKFDFPIHFIDKTNIQSKKKSGVGLARKVGLDEGLRRFTSQGKSGILVCLDADCTVGDKYLASVRGFFDKHQDLQACSIGFKHRFAELEGDELQAIVKYELHLRYYIQVQRWIALPFAFQTVGSAMAIRTGAYAGQGGMPILKAGEDFYFLHKFICISKCGNLPEPLVLPSGRVSDRVPFGTGRAVGEILEDKHEYLSYDPQSFEVLKFDLHQIFSRYPKFKNICASVSSVSKPFFESVELEAKLIECLKNTTDKASFIDRFFKWFDGFRLMKYVHYLRDNHFANIKILDAVNTFVKMKGEDLVFETEWEALQYMLAQDYPSEGQV